MENAAVSRFRQYLRINTISNRDTPCENYAAAVEFLKSQATAIGLPSKVVETAPGYYVLVVTWEGTRPELKSVMLNSHMDVVPVFPEHWTHDPFSAHKRENGDIVARGAQDMKCVGMQYIEAISRIKTSGVRLERTVHVTFVPDEEVGGDKGMVLFVKTEDFKMLNVGFALDEGLANPTSSYTVFYGERSPWWFTIRCPGKPGHGSRFIEDTAAEKFQKVVNEALQYRASQMQRLQSDPSAKLGDVTSLNLTLVKGGVQFNVVPSEMSASFDMRVSPWEDTAELTSLLEGWVAAAGKGCSLEFVTKTPQYPCTAVDDTNPWWKSMVRVYEKRNMKLELEIFPAATDGRQLRAIGIPTIGFSPINNTPILLHDHDEYLNEQVYLDGIEIYEDLISTLANTQTQ